MVGTAKARYTRETIVRGYKINWHAYVYAEYKLVVYLCRANVLDIEENMNSQAAIIAVGPVFTKMRQTFTWLDKKY
jgi:hypothetical protein